LNLKLVQALAQPVSGQSPLGVAKFVLGDADSRSVRFRIQGRLVE
jgi:hypothetical protein